MSHRIPGSLASRAVCSALWFLIVVSDGAAASDRTPPQTLVEDGACPFECCAYREWSTLAETTLLADPDDAAAVVAVVLPGTRVAGLTGKLIVTRPGRIEVLHDYRSLDSGHDYRKGDIVRVYAERGEGFFQVWHDGELFDEEATFMYQGHGGWDRCVTDGTCWGKRMAFPESTWWVKVKTPDGRVGWSRKPENFGDKDACG